MKLIKLFGLITFVFAVNVNASSVYYCRNEIKKFFNLSGGVYQVLEEDDGNGKGSDVWAKFDFTDASVSEFEQYTYTDHSVPYLGVGRILIFPLFFSIGPTGMVDISNVDVGHMKAGYYTASTSKTRIQKCKYKDGELLINIDVRHEDFSRYVIFKIVDFVKAANSEIRFYYDSDKKLKMQIKATESYGQIGDIFVKEPRIFTSRNLVVSPFVRE